jgi:streptogramin lyase
MWFTTEERVAGIGRATPSGHVTVVSDGISGSAGETVALAFDADGRLWFTVGDGKLGSLSPTGPPRIKFVSSPHNAIFGQSIARGANGDLWSTEGSLEGNNRTAYLVRITSSGQVTHVCEVDAGGLVSGIDGNVWFDFSHQPGHPGDGVGHIDPHGNVTGYLFGHRGLNTPVPGPEGDVWLTAFPYLTPAQEMPSALPTDPPSKILRIDPHEHSTRMCHA